MRRISLVAIWALSVAVWAADKLQPLNLKAGFWQVTTVSREDTPVPAALLEKLTAEQRARVADRVDAQKSKPGKTDVKKVCLTRKQLDQGFAFQPKEKSCKWKVVTSGGNKVEMRGECIDHGINTEETLRIEALGPEAAKGTRQSLTNDGNTSPSPTATFQATWIGATCKSR